MKALFYILALVATAGAAFFSYNNWHKFEGQRDKRIATNDQIKAVRVDDDAIRRDLNDERKKLKDALDEKLLREQSITQLKTTAVELEGKMKEADAKLAEQAEQDKQLQEALDQAMKVVKELGGDVNIDSLPEKLKELQGVKADREKKLEELNTLCEGATKKLANNRAEVARVVQKDNERSTHIRRNAMEAVLTSVNQEWGFVVIGAGSNTGFTPQTKLLVKRDGRLIGKLNPSAIEASQTIADIDLDSVVPGVRLQPGDKVILAEPATH